MRPAHRLVLAAALSAAPLCAADGDLRASFATGGVFSYGTTEHLRSLHGAVTAPDGAVVVYGYYIEVVDDQTTASGLHWRRVTASGVGTECNVEVPSSHYGWINDAAFDSGGDLVVAGQVSMEADSKWDFVVARFAYPACDLDETFDGDGLRNFDFGASLDAQGQSLVPYVFIQAIPDPPYIALELDYFVAGNVGPNNVGIARLNSSGSFDSDFHFDGKRALELGGVERARTLRRGPTGTLLLFGHSDAWDANNRDFFVASVTAQDGADDGEFGAAGLVHFDSALDEFPDDFAGSLVVSDEEKTYFVGSSSHDPNADAFVAELDEVGDPVDTFDGDGLRIYSAFSGGGNSSTQGSALVVQSDDKLLVAGDAGQAAGFGPGFHVARLAPNGGFDSGFGTAGIVKHGLDILPGTGESLTVGGIAQLGDGRIVVAGYAQAVEINKEFIVVLESSLIFADDFESRTTGNW